MRLASILLFTALILLSCNEEPTTIGSRFFEDGKLDVIYVDSLTVKASTIIFDSLVTSDATRFLIGYHSDSDVGNLSASAIFEMAPTAALSLDKDLTSYSRTTMVLVPDGYSYYDTSTHISLSVHELTQKMELVEGYLYNTSSVAYDEEAIGALTFLPKPKRSDTLEIQIADSFGSNIFSMAQQGAEEVSTAAAFIKKFKGIALVPDTSNSGAILGYNVSPEIRIYYWDKTQTPSQEAYLTIKGGTYLKYNKIAHDVEGTPLALVESQKESLSSALTNHMSFVQAGSGLALRLEIPYLKQILLENDDLTITNAVLELYPIEDGERNTPFPDRFILSAVNYKNEFFGSQSFEAELIEDVYLGRDTRYAVDIRSFIMQQLATEELNENALLLSPDGQTYRQSVDLVRIADQKGEKKLKLKLYCVVTKH